MINKYLESLPCNHCYSLYCMMSYRVWRLKQREKLCAALLFLLYLSASYVFYAIYTGESSQEQINKTSRQYFRGEKDKSTKFVSKGEFFLEYSSWKKKREWEENVDKNGEWEGGNEERSNILVHRKRTKEIWWSCHCSCIFPRIRKYLATLPITTSHR